jgi:hypothetical protein
MQKYSWNIEAFMDQPPRKGKQEDANDNSP